jgi:rhamnulokinase
MSSKVNLIAIDLGAESGRVILGKLNGKTLDIKELHRFSNIPVTLNDGMHWDALRLWNDILDGLLIAGRGGENQIASVGLDTWGVDFGLLDRNGSLLMNPHHYRDNRTDGMIEAATRKVSREEIFFNTGIQFMQLNTLYQLLSMVESHSPILDIAETFLTMPDLFNFWLTGEKVSEFSIATTTQCYNPMDRNWSKYILEKLGIPTGLFPQIVPPGTILGDMSSWITERIGYSGTKVIAPACHDTGSAVAAVPATSENFVWISSGTWSIMGVNLPEPTINPQSLQYNFTNEGGVGNTYRFSKNIMGLWLLQECRRTWQTQGLDFSYAELTELAEKTPVQNIVIDVDYLDFLKPGDMPGRIRAYCRATKQEIPDNVGSIVRTILESIALKYRWVLEKLEEQIDRRVDTIHIIGGGIQNQLLNQITADVTGRKIITGPIEATAIGNILTQAIALGHFHTLEETREVVQHSFRPGIYTPNNHIIWNEKYEKLLEFLQ